ncbi:3-hydroxybutyrate dehydrogenase [Modicisalibacter ilicicola DSM 19980]|uniref:3-hydroxybutyrate dehydrogenase n=1 Tax=Modicisalibacter ilicicola DSM 19980 TaxID=1121942 RepID=A0A1M4X5U6_9GAMM|nr:3-hydroxybutyrate dehydrogenase [Halomonas ilicicola]SHE88859.1 3-hydroxybutyrate dehydrogenase [Halomonas ilicicola DSM 19980]
MELNGKVAVITGGASGIGYKIAERFVEAGGRVAIADIDEGKAEQAAKALGDQAMAVEMDVTDERSVEDGVDKVAEKWGSIDILLSNAGVQIVHRLEDFPFEEWKKLTSIHLDGAFLTTKACIKHMYKQNSGVLLYMGSVHSKEASPLKSAYVAAKHGILGLARVMAVEGAKYGVRTNVICPGFVETPLVTKQIPEQAKNLGISEQEVRDDIMLGGTVDKEFTQTSDIAELALFLAAHPTNAFTGQSIVASHGWYMN